MSSTATVLTLHPDHPECPSWCARNTHAEATGSHIGTPIALHAPGRMTPTTEVPLLSVQLALDHDEEAGQQQPRIWLSTTDSTAELTDSSLAELVAGIDEFALRLRGLLHRYRTVIAGGAAECVDAYQSPTHPLELVTPCPPWCQYRDNTDEHAPDTLLIDHFHGTGEDPMEVQLQPSARTKRDPEPDAVELAMVHTPYAQEPQLDLTLSGGGAYKYVALTLTEAERLRSRLAELTAQGREYLQPNAVPTARELMEYCDVRLIEHDGSDQHFLGHAVGDTREPGPVWVTVPKGLSGPQRDDLVTDLLSEIHETQQELTAHDGTEICQAGAPPNEHTMLTQLPAA
ncbi:DUF6907 domain-containing protein [Streptomyces sp. NPDC059009]|uniref:DUF6907 domain-containing protein n=1 Tax=Streptomyces sp. NPDC059009 TaxID=3346694 RepID=UPI0036C17A42